MDSIDNFMVTRQPTALRPLLGLTVLLIEDSRFACEAVRLLCIRSGARIRRADSLTNAKRHLAVYRPSVMIVDVGLPDGSGINLIEAVAHGSPRISVILGTSGDPTMAGPVMAAGANGFLDKPIASLSAFQSAILAHLPADRQPPGPRLLSDEVVSPDRVAFHDDLSHVAEVLDERTDTNGTVDYVTNFLHGVAQSAADIDLERAAARLAQLKSKGAPLEGSLRDLSALVQDRLRESGPI
ncbi:Response regulator receiver domain-containing protein [Cognatiyoonia koreensis]|uniref:Response regulator receiver domain-containing protein n=1 Tax=Cognatiyoonia koreensis TaxID=364200 RepID=A0A1I0N2P4_9RHOB|nr:response regulator [Cognatiyoonia koreensis]SEV95334.1 Response regulator receiver domain-containing protein [Cognatiyoonia koreensis]